MLGWRGLQLKYIWFSPQEIEAGRGPASGLCVYYHTGAWRYALQVNEAKPEDDFTHKATIIPDRYGLRALDWHPFTLFEDDDRRAQEAERLKPYLCRQSFKNRRWLTEFKRQHPEKVLGRKGRNRGGNS